MLNRCCRRVLQFGNATSNFQPCGTPESSHLFKRENTFDGLEMKTARFFLLIPLLLAVPVARYLLELRLVAKCLPNGYAMYYILFSILFAPPLIGIAAALLAPMRRISHRVLLGLAFCGLTPVLALFAIPPGAVIYAQGFGHAVREGPGIPTLQRWAEGALREFGSGRGVTTNKPSYWNPGDVMLDRQLLPSFLTNGVFAHLDVPNFGPEFSVVTNTKRSGDSGECVAISWYLHGLFVGPPDFRIDWKPWYCKQLAPGVYVYHGMK